MEQDCDSDLTHLVPGPDEKRTDPCFGPRIFGHNNFFTELFDQMAFEGVQILWDVLEGKIEMRKT